MVKRYYIFNDYNDINKAAKNGQMDVIEYLRQQGYNWNKKISMLQKYKQYKLLKWQ